jgi:hypothetical protein
MPQLAPSVFTWKGVFEQPLRQRQRYSVEDVGILSSIWILNPFSSSPSQTHVLPLAFYR